MNQGNWEKRLTRVAGATGERSGVIHFVSRLGLICRVSFEYLQVIMKYQVSRRVVAAPLHKPISDQHGGVVLQVK